MGSPDFLEDAVGAEAQWVEPSSVVSPLAGPLQAGLIAEGGLKNRTRAASGEKYLANGLIIYKVKRCKSNQCLRVA